MCAGREALYMGHFLRNARIIEDPNHKWYNAEFIEHTSLHTYPRYAAGGGYVLSSDLVKALAQAERTVGLKRTSAEDVTTAMWLLQYDLRAISHPAFNRTEATTCCFNRGSKAAAAAAAAHAPVKLHPRVERLLCGPDAYAVLHKLDLPDEMRLVGKWARACSEPSGDE